MKPAKPIRCAIYTRVSTDQGLDQDFNSLDAQREAAEAYIKSQSHEGWTCLKQAFDDGGYSGGSMERPALQSLLGDVRAKKLDIIVVYKVDRLTRSLADFAKLVELFDANEVSFVSVTQSFNTTSSMGRLTLNVLLSFAQFEREVTGERIRDKVAASKKKGIWMGGNVPLGYRLEARKLLIAPSEAETVQHIFALFLELRSLAKLALKLEELGVKSRIRAHGANHTIGGQTFMKGALSYLLSNRIYIGEVKHHKQHYPGEHANIISPEQFEAVQAELALRRTKRANNNRNSNALLKGILFDSTGNPMTPVHANKAGVRYYYYNSSVLAQGQKHKAGIVSRVSAKEIESAVLGALAARMHHSPEQADNLLDKSKLIHAIERIAVMQDYLKIDLKSPTNTEGDDSPQKVQTICIPWSKPHSRRSRQVIGQSEEDQSKRPMRSETRARLLMGIAQGRIWLDRLLHSKTESIATIAQGHKLSEKSIRSTITLALLAPDIIEAAIDGKLPRGLTTTQMMDLPAGWAAQHQQLGLS
jgi:site-specific DNA recombinase